MTNVVEALVRILKSLVLIALGWSAFRLRRFAFFAHASRSAFEALRRVDRSSYTAHLYLGLLFAAERRMAAAGVCFTQCCLIDSARFRRSSLPEHLKDRILAGQSMLGSVGLDLGFFDEIWDFRAGDNESRPDGVDRRKRLRTPVTAVKEDDGDRPPPFPTDCATLREWRRFARLAPITAEDVARVDWDDILRRL